MFRTIILLALLLTLSILMLGSGIRLHDAAMGCPDWPGCYGTLIADEPLQALKHAVDAKNAVTTADHQWLSGMYASALLVPATLACCLLALSVFALWQGKASQGGFALWAALLLSGLVAWSGQWPPDLRMIPLVASLQWLALVMILVLWQWIYLRSKRVVSASYPVGVLLKWAVNLSLFVLFLQMATGIWTSTQFAGIACQDFPSCMGSYLPPDRHVADAFNLWTGLDKELSSGLLSPELRSLIHWVHRLGAFVSYLLLAGLGISLSSHPASLALRKSGVVLSFLLLLQIALGMASVLMRLPVGIVLAHDMLAALLVLNLVYVRVALFWTLLPPDISREAAADASPDLPEPVSSGVYDRLRQQLGKTRRGFFALWGGGRDESLDMVEEQLLMADVGVQVTGEVLASLREHVDMDGPDRAEQVRRVLRQLLGTILKPCSVPLTIPTDTRPFVILVVGVNGVGKTTTIGKLAKRLQQQGHSVMLAAGDTFRAAAVEQLQTWGERNQIPVIAQQSGSDSASVIFDAVQAAQARGVDVLIADTAGRLHNKSHLMDELSKIRRIMSRLDPAAPHEVLLVLDAGTGQNALSQAQLFHEAVQLTGIALTKLDGTARGGVIFALARKFAIPIRFIGIGEGIDDLRDFDADQFIDALFSIEGESSQRELFDA